MYQDIPSQILYHYIVQFGSQLFSPRRNVETDVGGGKEKENIDHVRLCSPCKVCMLISFSICQVLRNGNIIH
jgi:hypothetical protein